MKAIVANNEHGLQIVEKKVPTISATEVLVNVKFAALNRADILQKNGLYPPPPGTTEVLGLEFSGIIESVGSGVRGFEAGDEVCSIVAGGSYAEYVSVNYRHLIRKPTNISMAEAAAIPEAFITAYQSLIEIANLKKGEKLLIHAGASGVGSAAIQLAKKSGARVIVTASKTKHKYCFEQGADECINYKQHSFKDYIRSKHKKGVNVVLDLVGGNYFMDNLQVLSLEGRMVMLGFLGGVKSLEGNVAAIVTKRLQIFGSTLRSRSMEYKKELISGFTKDYIKEGLFPFKVNLDKEFSFEKVNDAHRYMEENKNRGKIVVKVG